MTDKEINRQDNPDMERTAARRARDRAGAA